MRISPQEPSSRRRRASATVRHPAVSPMARTLAGRRCRRASRFRCLAPEPSSACRKLESTAGVDIMPEFLLNGRRASLDGAAVQTTLLDYIRDQGLTGAKEGCAEGECGACTVLMLADSPGGCAYRAVNSCLLFAPMVAGREIYTVEALARNGQLAEVQKAMAAAGRSQCRYC